jgi:hypothetical protein
MKSLLGGFALLLCLPTGHAQNIEGQIIASQYGSWQVQGMQPDTYAFTPTSCRVQGGASFFDAFSAGTSVKIVDGNPALTEIVTPTVVIENNATCSISITPQFHHDLPFYITSATGGLQEAINANRESPGANTIILNNAWYQLGGSASVIAQAKGTTELGLVDVTTVPSNWYEWNGTQYVLVPIAPSEYVSQVVAGQDITISPSSGTGVVTINASGGVTSVFGRTGTVTAQTGDYNCLMVTDCESQAGTFWDGSFTNGINSTDATASITLANGTLPSWGYFWVDSEWMGFSDVSSMGAGVYSVTLTRGVHGTAAQSHAAGAALTPELFQMSALSQANNLWVGADPSPFLSIDCPFYTANVSLSVDCGNFGIDNNGSLTTDQNAYFTGEVYLGWSSGAENLDYSMPMAHSYEIVQNNYPNAVSSQVSFINGFPESVKSVQTTAPAPVLQRYFVPSGSTTYTYYVGGTGELGGNIVGMTASITDLAASGWTTPNDYIAIYGVVPGATSWYVCRTSGGPNQGIIASGTGAYTQNVVDSYTSASAACPGATTTEPAHTCTNGLQYCQLSGTVTSPPLACSSTAPVPTNGWDYVDVAATEAPSHYHCYQGATTWTALSY